MHFFKSILAEDPDPPSPENPQVSEPNSPTDSDHELSSHDESDSDPNSSSDPGWSFGGFMKNFATRSDSVIETYRRDLEEFRTGLQKETELFKEAASRAVQDLPASIEVGASMAQGMIKSTADIISQGKETLLAPSDSDLDASDVNNYSTRCLDSRRYSRFDAQLKSIQSDVHTYCEEPEDLDDYNKWKIVFVLEEKNEEINILINENADVERIYKKVVPNDVDQATFWCRYFYRVHKLKHQEYVRASLVKRAIAIDDEEELSWDVDDDDDEEDDYEEKNVPLSGNENNGSSNEDLPQVPNEESSRVVDTTSNESKPNPTVDEDNVVEESTQVLKTEGTANTEVSNEKSVLKSDKVDVEENADQGESSKDSNISVQPSRTLSLEEEDLEWDEIEDVGNTDEKKVSHGESPNITDRVKRLSVTEDDEDLSWGDMEDDDEPLKDNAK